MKSIRHVKQMKVFQSVRLVVCALKFQVSYFMMLLILRLCSVDSRLINECGAVGGMRISKGSSGTPENVCQFHFAHHTFHMTLPGNEPGLPWWEAGD
jgi:hypothetical protein